MESLTASIPQQFRNSAPRFDPSLLAIMKADGYNAQPGDLGGYGCKKCLNKGVTAIVRDDFSIAFEECSCMKIRRCVWKMEQSGMHNVISRFTFDSFTERENWQRTMKQTAMNYAKAPAGWLMICGQSGAGKTHLCVAVCRDLLLAGKQVVYMPWMSEAGDLKGYNLDADVRASRMNALKNAEVLYIDDLFKSGNTEETRPTSADVRLAFDLLNQRYLDSKLTIISTEFAPDALVEIDEAVGGRILEMCGANLLAVRKDLRKNYRLRGVIE